ncbi:MAG: peptidase MA family metallohydrolase [Candidatus Marinimicrobia bacterium]|nr:peptidase MA family metallohydrolase [Candidatus Neomarinimicrobiota bacterium]
MYNYKKNKYNLTKILLLFLIFFLSIESSLFGIEKKYKKFTIIYNKQDELVANKLTKEIQLEIIRIKKKYNLELNNFQIIISDSEDKFKGEFGKDFPDWAVAAAKYPSRKIILKSPSFSKQYIPELRKTVIHEMVHISLEPIIKNKYFPRWLNEGMAQYEAEQFSIQKKILLGRILLYSDYMQLNKIDDVLKFKTRKANLAYAQSVSAFKFLIDEFGTENYKKFLIFLSENQKVEDAFKNAYKFSLQEFESYWNLWAHKRYKFYVLIDINSMIWMLMPVLLLIAWIVVKNRNSQKFKQWEDEELYELLKKESEKKIEN